MLTESSGAPVYSLCGFYYENTIMINFQNTPEFLEAKPLLIEKKQLQARLREIDKLLRNLETIRPSVTAYARTDLDSAGH